VKIIVFDYNDGVPIPYFFPSQENIENIKNLIKEQNYQDFKLVTHLSDILFIFYYKKSENLFHPFTQSPIETLHIESGKFSIVISSFLNELNKYANIENIIEEIIK